MNKIKIILVALSVLLTATTAFSATQEDVQRSFFPYKGGAPSNDNLEIGMVINQSNVESVKDALDSGTYQFIKDGWVTVTVAPTTDFALHKNYIDATLDHLNKTTLGEKVGQINGFIAGRPFPEEPSLNDPQAGVKLAWNYKYGYNWGDNAAVYPEYWKYWNMKTGKLERTLRLKFNFLNYKHRVNKDQPPVPDIPNNPSDIFRGIYVQITEPFDVRNTQVLIKRYENDLRRDDAWLYLGFQRRVRRLATGEVTDSFLGTDLMIEDFEGYNGRVSDANWTYKGSKNVLLPFYNHNDQKLTEDHAKKDGKDGYRFVGLHGKGSCFPDVTWQLRKVYVVESAAVDPNHPISKRVHYIDAQTFTLPRTLIYDRKGDLWKSFTINQAHPDHHLPINKGTGVSLDDGFSMVDVQAQHCTTGQFKGIVDPELNPVSTFTVQHMRAVGK